MRLRVTAVIGRALEAARGVLRDLEADQVPASLRRVVAHAGDLTPPLADKLAREIDRLDWLRRDAAKNWPEADPKAAGPDRGSALFLLRPEGWAIDLIGVAGDAAAAAAVAEGKRSGRVDEARDRELEVAREKAKAAAKEVADLQRKIAGLERAERAPERERATTVARESEALRTAAQRHAHEAEEMRRRLTAAEASLAAARDEVRQAKRERAEAERRLDAIRHAGSWANRDPVDLAVHLDAVAAQARLRPSIAGTGGALAPPRLPAGVRPDSAAAVEAVLRMPGPIAVLVDGYNAGLALGAAGSPGEVRGRLEDVLRRVRTLGGAGMTVSVVWDSAHDLGPRRVPDSIDVRFAPPGVPADDVLVELAGAAPRVVVVTNDRDVRERAGAVGALTLWSTALVHWAKRR